MTSSLVGSEMCIRDSIRADLTSFEDLEVSNQVTPGEVKAMKQEGIHPKSCLLYTSDAADDM
eukprot:11116552-Prorocentrum_lima.AAC.1